MKQTKEVKIQQQAEALSRAVLGQSAMNYEPIFVGFAAKGIPLEQIEPRVNVLTYAAWQAVGRQVKKGEKGVKVTTFVPVTKKREGAAPDKFKMARSTTVFHITQTDEATAG